MLQVGFNIILESPLIIHANSKIIIKTNYPEFGIEVRYNFKIIREISGIYVRLFILYKFRYRTVFSARFGKQDEDNQVSDETELFINFNISHNLTESNLDKIDVRSPLEHQIQQQETKDSGWRLDKNNSMTINFSQTCIMNGSNYIKIPLRSNAILDIENIDNYCFIRSILATLHRCNNNHPNRVSI